MKAILDIITKHYQDTHKVLSITQDRSIIKVAFADAIYPDDIKFLEHLRANLGSRYLIAVSPQSHLTAYITPF